MKSVVKEFLELCIFKLSRKTGVPNSRIYFVPHTQIRSPGAKATRLITCFWTAVRQLTVLSETKQC